MARKGFGAVSLHKLYLNILIGSKQSYLGIVFGKLNGQLQIWWTYIYRKQNKTAYVFEKAILFIILLHVNEFTCWAAHFL